jgi:PAS domain S-box-containing protein
MSQSMSAAATTASRRTPRKQWLVLALALLLLGGQMTYDLLATRTLLETEAKSRLENHSLVLRDELERRLRSIDNVLNWVRADVPLRLTHKDGPALVAKEMTILTGAMEGVRTFLMLDASGTTLVSNRPELIGDNFAHRPYFKEFAENPQPDRLHLSAPFLTILNVYSLNLVRPIVGPGGEFAGIVSATLDINGLRDLMLSLHANPDTRLSMVHGNGMLLQLVPERPDVPPGTLVDKPSSFFRQHMASGKTESLITGISDAVNTESYMSMRTLQPAGIGLTSPLVVAAARDRASVLAPWEQQRKLRLGLFLLIAAAMALALAIYQQRQRQFARELQTKEAERQRSALTLQRFIDHLPGTAYVKDVNSVTLMASHGFQTLLGMDPDTVTGKTTAELFPGEFGAKILADDQQVLKSGTTTVIEEAFNGRDYESTKFVIDTSEGERQLGGMTLDITPRKVAERALATQMIALQELNKKLEDAQNQLLQSEKMASLGQLAAGIAHELNNPIGFVYSNLGTLETYLHDIFEIARVCEQAIDRSSAPADIAAIQALKQSKDFDFMRSDVFALMAESQDGLARVKKIVQDLKDFSRPGESEWQWANLHAGLDSTLNIVGNELKYKCTVTKDYGELPLVHCLLAQLNQVFLNLLVNAGHAIVEKGGITLRTGRQGDEVFVAISDTGAGIPPENIHRIFEPFFTTKPIGKGTGLGLSIVYGIVQKHHGRIDVASELGKGSTFTVWLPIDPTAVTEPAVPPAPTFCGNVTTHKDLRIEK